MVGPVTGGLKDYVHCSPIGLVPKGQDSGRWRMIVDLSAPSGRSVNDGIAEDYCSVKYSSVDEAVKFVTMLGQHTVLIKVDLKSAYRFVPIHPADRHLLGIQWEGSVYVDQALPFGLRSAPILFTAVADAIGFALLRGGVPFFIHYLDDFLFFVRPGVSAGPILQHILSLLQFLGVPVASEKIEGPATSLTFLGIVIDSSRLELRLPDRKITHIQGLLASWLQRRSGPRADFESLLGHLSHAAIVVRQGRVFLRHLFNLLSATRSRFHHVHLDAMARADLRWWRCFLQSWNGTMFYLSPRSPAVQVISDASGSFGCGAILGSAQWLQIPWPGSWSSVNIVVKELVPIVVAAAVWGRSWYKALVEFHSDNMAVVEIVRKRSARDPLTHHLLRCFYFYAAFYQFDYCIEHVPGVDNMLADAISRDNLPLFRSFLPQARRIGVPLPVLNLLITQLPDWGSEPWTLLFISTLQVPLPHLLSLPIGQPLLVTHSSVRGSTSNHSPFGRRLS